MSTWLDHVIYLLLMIYSAWANSWLGYYPKYFWRGLASENRDLVTTFDPPPFCECVVGNPVAGVPSRTRKETWSGGDLNVVWGAEYV